ncbi:MAG: TIGR02281 family clan AA aspartic protease [Alphaproteobacteria bacterium]|jgi:aspartyl protease family protein
MFDADSIARVIFLGILLASLVGWVIVESRKRLGQTLRSALAWVLIVVGLMAGYGLWSDIGRQIMPVQAVEAGQIVIPRAADGHYYLKLSIGGQDLRFMADTGASSVVLSPADARRLAIDPAQLVYTGQAVTANGVVRTATVQLKDVMLGPFRDAVVVAQVNETDMAGSLLGMDYLGQFSVTMAADKMILTR